MKLLKNLQKSMHIEYLSKKRRPKVDATFIDKVTQRYYPQMKDLLRNINDPQNQATIHKLVENANKKLESMQDAVQQQITSKAIIEARSEIVDKEALEKNIVRNIMNVTRDYDLDSIHAAFLKVIAKCNSEDEGDITRAVFQTLQGPKVTKHPSTSGKKQAKPSTNNMLNDILNSMR